MTTKQHRSLARYIARLAVEMGLRDWTFNYHTEPCEDHALASVDTVYGRKIANVAVCADFDEQTPETQRNAVVHELIHVHFAYERQVVHDLTEHLGNRRGSLAHDGYSLAHEYGVDGLADAIAQFYPLWEQ